MRALIYFILGALVTAGGIFWIITAGHTPAAIVAGLVTAIGASLLVTAFAVFTDIMSPTSTKI
jgi:hypothetical protein